MTDRYTLMLAHRYLNLRIYRIETTSVNTNPYAAIPRLRHRCILYISRHNASHRCLAPFHTYVHPRPTPCSIISPPEHIRMEIKNDGLHPTTEASILPRGCNPSISQYYAWPERQRVESPFRSGRAGGEPTSTPLFRSTLGVE